jgi:DNA-binding IclR family transcriptional regulator
MNQLHLHQTSPAYSAPAAACAAEVLRLLAGAPEPRTTADISREIGRSKSLVFRVLRELEARDLVSRAEDGRYWLSFGVLELGGAFLANSQFVRSAQLALRELSRQSGETSNMGVLRDLDVLYVLKQEGRNSIVTISHVGARIPAHCSALGKAILSQLSDQEVIARFGENLEPMTQRSIRTRAELLADLEKTRERGYAIELGESILGRCCIATYVPLAQDSDEYAGVSLSFAGEDYAAIDDGQLEMLLLTAQRLQREAAARSLIGQLESGSGSALRPAPSSS